MQCNNANSAAAATAAAAFIAALAAMAAANVITAALGNDNDESLMPIVILLPQEMQGQPSQPDSRSV